MFTNISDLMSFYGVEGFAQFRISRRGNWVVAGYGELTSEYDDGYSAGGTVTYYTIEAVYLNDGTGTLINFTVEESGGYDY